jgi:hypothetical protein
MAGNRGRCGPPLRKSSFQISASPSGAEQSSQSDNPSLRIQRLAGKGAWVLEDEEGGQEGRGPA